MRRFSSIVLFFALLAPSLAHADDTRTCAKAAEQAQRLKNSGKLLESRDQLRICTRSSCPAVIRRDCDAWTTEIEASLSSVVIAARDAKGNDVTRARVTIDDAIATESLDGKALSLDPGAHTIRVEREGDAPFEQKLVVREGEKRRLVTVTMRPLEPGQVATTISPTPPPDSTGGDTGAQPSPPAASSSSGVPVAPIVLGVVGIAALASAAYFRVSANNDITNLRNTCAPKCDSSSVDSINSKAVVADVGLGVGVVAIGVAGYLLISHLLEPKSTTSTGHIQIAPHGLALTF
jgi:hypothetical protein